MKKIYLLLCLLFSLLFVNAQTYEKANKELDQYFSEKDFNYEIVQKSFNSFLKTNKIKHRNIDDHIAYYIFIKNITQDWKIKESKQSVEEFEKLSLYTNREFIHKTLEIIRDIDMIYKNKAFNELSLSLLEGPTSYDKIAFLLSKSFNPEEFKNPLIQKFMICLIYSQLLPTEYKTNEELLSTELNHKLDELLKKNKLNYSEIETCFKEMAALYGILFPGEINEGYFQLADSTLTVGNNISISESSIACLNKFQPFEIYPELYATFKELKSQKDLKIKIWSPLNSVEEMLNVILKAGDVSPFIIMMGIKISFSNSDLNVEAYKKLFMIMSLNSFQYMINESETNSYETD